ncbi:MAG: hypothetical protein NTY53_10505 [Kiritimatiellaeota bacterium]|nr:hypothetical protein [Kiritimatiellota bacterium]
MTRSEALSASSYSQALEKYFSGFPDLGKSHGKFSGALKISRLFPALENFASGLAAVAADV